MVHKTDENKNPGVFRSLDWLTVAIYVALLIFGWVSVCGASYTYGDTDIFSLSSRSGMQIVWIGTSLVLGLVLLLLDERIYDGSAWLIYGFLLIVLLATIFNPHEIKGSRSWLVLGPLRVQPAEFAKFATSLAVAKFLSISGIDIRQWRNFAIASAIVLLPMLMIIGQKETGSALVYLSFFLVFYREGMSGSVLLGAVAMVVYFVVGVKFDAVALWQTPASLGRSGVLLLIQLFTIGMVGAYCREVKEAFMLALEVIVATLAALLIAKYVIAFDIVYVQLILTVALVIYLVVKGMNLRLKSYYFLALFAVASVGFYFSTNYVMNDLMQAHQRTRINVLLGLEEDLRGAGYNVHQSQIAIGSGGLLGKGFLNGTQTKLKFVPEQDTDFIFCTVGEEEGFIGASAVLLLFLLLIWRIISLAERQPLVFGRIYGYCVASIFLFHLFINVGMVLGLTPVIGIPLPFFSYGGSNLWGFTLLLFTFLRLDASRHLVRRFK